MARKYGVPLKSGDNTASISALVRELGGHVEDGQIVYIAKHQADAEQKLSRAARRAVKKGR